MDRYFFEITNRPVRIGFLLGDNPSKRLVNTILRLNTGLWGGIYNLICPTDGEYINDKFLNFLMRIKPDCIVLAGKFRNKKNTLRQLEDNKIHPSFLFKHDPLSHLEQFGIGSEGVFDNFFSQLFQRTFLPRIGIVHAGKGQVPLIEKFKFGIPPKRLTDYCKDRVDLITVLRYNRESQNRETPYDKITGMLQIGSDNIEQTALTVGRLNTPAHVLMLARRSTVIVLGKKDSLEDACFYWNVRACIGKDTVDWMPSEELPSLFNSKRLEELVTTRKWKRRITLTSASHVIMRNIRSKLTTFKSSRIQLKTKDPEKVFDYSFPYMSLLCERRTEHVTTESHVAIIAASAPHSFDIIYPKPSPRWVVDLRILRDRAVGAEGLILPDLPNMYNLVIQRENVEFQPRIRRDVFSFQLKPKVEHIRLNMPTDWDIIRQIFQPLYSNICLSDQGRYMSRVLGMLGDLSHLYRLIDDWRITAILDEFLRHHKSGEMVTDKAYRRVLTLENMRAIVASKAGTRSRKEKEENDNFVTRMVEELIGLGVIHSGYVLDCPHCSLEDWYPIDEVTETFRCRRCLTTQQRPLSPSIHFRLNETLYQAYASNFRVPIYALNFLRQFSRSSFIFCPQIKLDSNDVHSPELDIIAIRDGELVIGEAKSNTTISRAKVNALGDIARTAKANYVVFATTSRDSCSKLNCNSCLNERYFADNAFTHGSDDSGQNGTREFIRNLRTGLRPDKIEVITLCAESLVRHSIAQRKTSRNLTIPGL